jgi:hypothetical protein
VLSQLHCSVLSLFRFLDVAVRAFRLSGIMVDAFSQMWLSGMVNAFS